MSKIKYDPSVDQLHGKINGSCFQSNSQLPTLRANPKMRQFRTNPQTYSQMLTGYFVRIWRDLDPAFQSAWNNFATTFPQRVVSGDRRYLTGFQLFVKRHYYLNEFCDIDLTLMSSPVMISYPRDFATIQVQVSESKIYLVLQFENADSTLDCLIEISGTQSPGKNFQGSQPRFSLKTINFNQQVDVTDRYLASFGRLPLLGGKLFASSVLCGSDNGQFWHSEQQVIAVTPFIPIYSIVKLGYLYNCATLTDSRNICAPGWCLPNYFEMIQLLDELGGQLAGGAHTKEVSDEFWLHVDPLGDNSTGFSARGSGYMLPDGYPMGFYSNARYAGSISFPGFGIYAFQINANDNLIQPLGLNNLRDGLSFRPIRSRDDSIVNYVGNDGHVYNVIHTASFTVVAEQLVESQFQNHDPIPFCSSSAEWASTDEPCYAYPDYLIDNAYFFLVPL